MLEIYQGALPTQEIYAKWEAMAKGESQALEPKDGALHNLGQSPRENPSQSLSQTQNLERFKNGALCVFTGIVRAEGGISALSFDIYEPLLRRWFEAWQRRANEEFGAVIFMAHSLGDVACGESSYMCAILSPKRRAALEIYEEFIEDFKANAPIWKYDVIEGKRIYAQERSKALSGSGILSDGVLSAPQKSLDSQTFQNLGSAPKIFAFSGRSNSGKTTLICKLAQYFEERGHGVGIIKHDPGDKARFDTEGKDSYKFYQSSSASALISPTRAVLQSKALERSEEELFSATLEQMSGKLSFIFVEGLKHLPYPRIVVARGEIDSDYIACASAFAIDESVENAAILPPHLPTLELNNIEQIARFIQSFRI